MYGASMTDVHVHVLRKMFFRLVMSVGQRKILSPHEESNLRPSDLRSDALPLSHKDSSVSGVNYEVLLFCQKHYAIDIADPSSMQDACH